MREKVKHFRAQKSLFSVHLCMLAMLANLARNRGTNNMKVIAVRIFVICFLVIGAASAVEASTIIKLNLGGVGPDVAMNAQGALSTVDDAIAGTTGNQNTAIEYTGFLEPIADIDSAAASFTLSGLQTAGIVQQLGSLATQGFFGGQLSLWDSANNLLLTGSLSNSVLTGVIGPPGTAALFTTSLSSISGGSLKPFIADGSVSLSMSLTNLNGGLGLAISDSLLQPFTADATLGLAGDSSGLNAPEPSAFVLLGMGCVGLFARRRS
jgi:hypothetical protein